jgi:hypothetical protein
MPSEQRVRANKWCQFKRVFSDGKSENRYIREIIYGKKGAVTYWEITTDPETMPPNSTSFVKTNLKGKLKKIVGNLYGLRTWVEYGFRQCKQELGWTDYRFTNFKDLEKWWSIIFCVYTMISLNSPAFLSLNLCDGTQSNPNNNSANFSAHQQWNHKSGWNNTLNNFRLVIQPMLLFWLICPWLEIFPNSNLLIGFKHLIDAMNQFQPFYSSA